MKRFTNKQECLDWLAENFDSYGDAINAFNDKVWTGPITLLQLDGLFKTKHTDLDSKQQLEQRVVESFGDVDLNNKSGSVEFFDAVEIKETIIERTANYGEFEVNSKVMQGMKKLAKTGSSWDKMSSYQKEAVEMILHKIGRIVCGDPDYIDSWHDIAGYAKLVEDILESAKRAIELSDAEAG